MKRAHALQIVRTMHGLVVEAEALTERLEGIDAEIAQSPSLALLATKVKVFRELCLTEAAIRDMAQRHAPHSFVTEDGLTGVDWRLHAPTIGGAS